MPEGRISQYKTCALATSNNPLSPDLARSARSQQDGAGVFKLTIKNHFHEKYRRAEVERFLVISPAEEATFKHRDRRSVLLVTGRRWFLRRASHGPSPFNARGTDAG